MTRIVNYLKNDWQYRLFSQSLIKILKSCSAIDVRKSCSSESIHKVVKHLLTVMFGLLVILIIKLGSHRVGITKVAY